MTPYTIETKKDINIILSAYKRNQTFNHHVRRRADINEAPVYSFLMYLSHIRTGDGQTKRPVRLDAAHKYIERYLDSGSYITDGEDIRVLRSFFNAMEESMMIEEPVNRKAQEILENYDPDRMNIGEDVSVGEINVG